MNDEPEKIILPLKEAEIFYYPRFFSLETSNSYFDILKSTIAWRQEEVKVFGKVYPQPRLTALYANNKKEYTYSGLTLKPETFTDTLQEIKAKVEQLYKHTFTSCLLNLYRSGSDSNGWHADDEKELGKNPVIASISLGQERMFHLRHKKSKEWKHKLLLENGSLLIMAGATQHHWQHQLPKTRKTIGERINLTYRFIP